MVTADNRDEILAALGYGDLKVTGRLVDASNATLLQANVRYGISLMARSRIVNTLLT